MKTGLFFGSFNPIHIGHLALANYMLEYAGLDELWFVVSPHNPLKEESMLVSDAHRLAMAQIAIGHCSKIHVCDIELHLTKPSYTINTLDALEKKYPNKHWQIIMGTDGLYTFDKWKNYEEIIERCERLVYPRNGNDTSELPFMENARLVNAPMFDISSTFLRQAIQQQKDIRFFLPTGVYEYIIAHNLYC